MAGQTEFLNIVSEIAAKTGEAELSPALEARPNEKFPATGPQSVRLFALCAHGETEGRLVACEPSGI
jgi:hypothetical protein